MWKEIVIFAAFMVVVAIGIWAKCKALDDLVAQHHELDEEEEN